MRSWVEQNRESGALQSPQELDDVTERLEFALLVAVLQNRIHYLLSHWRQVEIPLGLEASGSLLFHRPPEDYRPFLPVPPMGQVLAFQYLRASGDKGQPGDLRFFRCAAIGRWLLLHFHEMFAADGIQGPHVLLLSGTSWAGSSPSNHIQTAVGGVLSAPAVEIDAINRSRFEFLPSRDETGHPITISGKTGADREYALKSLLNSLARPNTWGRSLLEQRREILPEDRRRILLLVGSYDEAKAAYDALLQIQPAWKHAMRYLVPDDSDFGEEWHGGSSGESLRRGRVFRFAHTGAWLLIAPLLAVERGHNILTEQGDRAALGAAYFLIRPHPRPDDINFAIHSINRWAIDVQQDAAEMIKLCSGRSPSLGIAGTAFRSKAHRQWRHLLRLPMRYSTLPSETRDAVAWSQLVTIWQVIGRLVRGGSEAYVCFCDAAFAPRTASSDEAPDDASSSLLVGMKAVLRPYFDDKTSDTLSDSTLVRTLYGPFYHALKNMGGLRDGTH